MLNRESVPMSTEALAFAVESPFNPHETGSRAPCQRTLMHHLAAHVHADDGPAIAALLENQPDCDAVVAGLRASLYSPLHQALAHGKVSALKTLLDRLPLGVWQMRTADTGRTPLMSAAENGHGVVAYDIMREVHARVNNAGRQSLFKRPGFIAALTQEFDCEHEAGCPKCNVWLKIVNATDAQGNTALVLAVQNNHVEGTAALLDLAADHEIKNNVGDSAASLVMELPKKSKMHRLFVPVFTEAT